ncbi:MAG TPA: hypothetical protein VF701_21060 [Thermoanaerobaculia bacterium]
MIFEFFATYVDYVFLFRKESEPPWSNQRWAELYPLLQLLVQHLNTAAPSIHVTKLKGNMSESVRLRHVNWNSQASQAWNGPEGRFIDLQIFAPSKEMLLSRGGFPKFYAHIEKVFEAEQSSAVYGSILHLAIRKREMRRGSPHVQSVPVGLGELSGVVGAYTSEVRVRSLNRFEDVTLQDFSYRGMLEEPLPDLSRMPRAWLRLMGNGVAE